MIDEARVDGLSKSLTQKLYLTHVLPIFNAFLLASMIMAATNSKGFLLRVNLAS